jgi:hypothetical protein
MINLETGKRYRCANGRWAIICDDFNWKGELRFAAIIQGRATPDWYTKMAFCVVQKTIFI